MLACTGANRDLQLAADAPIVLLAHTPSGMAAAVSNGVGLQLSGHTHGGQLWPQHISLLGYDAISGLHAFGDSYIFVSKGAVGWGPRIRSMCSTDIALITLRTPALFAEEGLEADTSLTVATVGMYAAVVLLPLSVIACAVVSFRARAAKAWAARGKRDVDVGGVVVTPV